MKVNKFDYRNNQNILVSIEKHTYLQKDQQM